AGFADYFISETAWPELIAKLEVTGNVDGIENAAESAPESDLAAQQAEIDRFFKLESFREILTALHASRSDLSQRIRAALAPNAPLAMAAALELIHGARRYVTIEPALIAEYRFVHRIVAQGDFREGIRAAIIDRDKTPRWRHADLAGPTAEEIAAMLAPLGEDDWSWEGWR
ncbi:MAG: enoyl-CoA hydratase/isomerase family protein, partial [Paracoccaceae bacterium]